jgi:hypothetical protein
MLKSSDLGDRNLMPGQQSAIPVPVPVKEIVVPLSRIAVKKTPLPENPKIVSAAQVFTPSALKLNQDGYDQPPKEQQRYEELKQ